MTAVRCRWLRSRRPIIIALLAAMAYGGTAAILWWQMDVRPRATMDPTIWDGRSLTDAVRQAKAKEEYGFWPQLVGFTPDVQRFVSCSLPPEGHGLGGFVQVWETGSGRELARWPITPDKLEDWTMVELKASPDLRYVTFSYSRAGESHGTKRLLDLKSGRERTWPAANFAWSPDSRWLANVAVDELSRHVLKILDAASGEEVGVVAHRLVKPTDEEMPFQHLTFLADGRTLAFVTHPHLGASSRRYLKRGFHRATAITLWDIPSGQVRRRIDLGSARELAFAPDGKTVAYFSRTTQTQWLNRLDLSTGRHLGKKELTSLGDFRELSFSADSSRLLAIADIDIPYMGSDTGPPYPFKQLAVFDAQSLSLLSSLKTGGSPETSLEEFDDRSQTLLPRFVEHRQWQVKISGNTTSRVGSAKVTLVDVISGTVCFTLPEEKGTSEARIENSGCQLSLDKRLLVMFQSRKKHDRLREWLAKYMSFVQAPGAEEENWLRSWDITTAHEYPTLPGCQWGLAFAPDSRSLATLGDDGTIQLWDLPPHKPLGLILAWSCVPAALVLLFAWWRSRRRVRVAASTI